jgi:hypothetical protein
MIVLIVRDSCGLGLTNDELIVKFGKGLVHSYEQYSQYNESSDNYKVEEELESFWMQ